MKLKRFSNLEVHLLYPKLVHVQEDWFMGGREGYDLQASTGFSFRWPNEDCGGWFSATILGLGLGFYWGDLRDWSVYD